MISGFSVLFIYFNHKFLSKLPSGHTYVESTLVFGWICKLIQRWFNGSTLIQCWFNIEFASWINVDGTMLHQRWQRWINIASMLHLNVDSTQPHDIESTLFQCWFNVLCPLGRKFGVLLVASDKTEIVFTENWWFLINRSLISIQYRPNHILLHKYKNKKVSHVIRYCECMLYEVILGFFKMYVASFQNNWGKTIDSQLVFFNMINWYYWALCV